MISITTLETQWGDSLYERENDSSHQGLSRLDEISFDQIHLKSFKGKLSCQWRSMEHQNQKGMIETPPQST
jgi:hypothetical protein